jgi:hypothetical protein
MKNAILGLTVVTLMTWAPALADAQEATVQVGTPAAVAAQPTTMVVVGGEAPDEPRDYARVRFHAALAGGGFLGDVLGGMGGLSLGIGVQFDQYFGLFYQAQGFAGGFIEGGQAGMIGAFLFNSVLFDVTLGHVLQLGVGPSLDFIAGCGASAAAAGCGDGGPFFGIDGRVALALGGHDVGTRGGFLISADVHPTFFPGGVSVALVLGLGGQVY